MTPEINRNSSRIEARKVQMEEEQLLKYDALYIIPMLQASYIVL